MSTYCPIVVDYTTDEAVLAGLLNDYRLVVHRLPLRTVCDYVLTTKAGSQFTTSERENYVYWSKRLANAAQDPLPIETLRILRMQALMNYPGKGHYMRYLASQQTEKVLLFTCNQQQAEAQAEHTYHSKNKHSQANLAKFNAGDIPRLACVAQLSEGISISNLRVGIIWHSFGNVYQDTVDEQWVTQALEAFDPAKVSYVDAHLPPLGND